MNLKLSNQDSNIYYFSNSTPKSLISSFLINYVLKLYLIKQTLNVYKHFMPLRYKRIDFLNLDISNHPSHIIANHIHTYIKVSHCCKTNALIIES